MKTPDTNPLTRRAYPWEYGRRAGATPTPLRPWHERRVALLASIENRSWRAVYDLGRRQWAADKARLIKEGLLVLGPKPGPRLRYREPPRLPYSRYSTRLTNRSQHCKSLHLTDKGRALLPVPAVALLPQPYAKRRAALAEFKEANP